MCQALDGKWVAWIIQSNHVKNMQHHNSIYKTYMKKQTYQGYLGNWPKIIKLLKNFLWLHHAACGILGARPGIKPVTLAIGNTES